MGRVSSCQRGRWARTSHDAQLEVAKVCHDDRVRDDRSLGILDLNLKASRWCPGDRFARVTLDQEVFELEDRLDVRVEVREAQIVEVVDRSSRADKPRRRHVDTERENGVLGQVEEVERRAGSEGNQQ